MLTFSLYLKTVLSGCFAEGLEHPVKAIIITAASICRPIILTIGFMVIRLPKVVFFGVNDDLNFAYIYVTNLTAVNHELLSGKIRLGNFPLNCKFRIQVDRLFMSKKYFFNKNEQVTCCRYSVNHGLHCLLYGISGFKINNKINAHTN